MCADGSSLLKSVMKDKERLQNEIVRLEGLIKISKDDLDLTRSSLEAQLKVFPFFICHFFYVVARD